MNILQKLVSKQHLLSNELLALYLDLVVLERTSISIRSLRWNKTSQNGWLRPFVTYCIEFLDFFFIPQLQFCFRLFDKWLKLKVTIVFVAVCQSFCLIFVFQIFFSLSFSVLIWNLLRSFKEKKNYRQILSFI